MVTSLRPSDFANAGKRRVLFVGSAASLAGALVFVLSAIVMVVLWVGLLYQTMSWLGLGLGLLTSPVAAAYPFLHWMARGEFPTVIFLIWFAGIAGLAVTVTWAAWGRYKVIESDSRRRSPLTRVATDEVD